MKVTLILDGAPQRPCALPESNAFAIASGACPLCRKAPFHVVGRNNHAVDDRYYEAQARCCACSGDVGTLHAEPSTIFGLREDEAVLHGRPRVY